MTKQELLIDIQTLKTAIESTNSPYLKRDYEKNLKKKLKQLRYVESQGQ